MESNTVNVRFLSKCNVLTLENSRLDCLKTGVAACCGLQEEYFYLTQNGRILTEENQFTTQQPVDVNLRLLGGKGGFGSMLRAIGAQIEKTTNRDACRDLSGRRLRDINEEQRLKRWFAKQAERELEKEEQRKKKLEKLRKFNEGPPLPILDDPEYNRQRAEMADSVHEAVDKGYEASKPSKSTTSSSSSGDDSCPIPEKGTTEEIPAASSSVPSSSTASSSKPVETKVPPKKKMKKLMMDEDFSDSSSDDSESEPVAKKSKMSN